MQRNPLVSVIVATYQQERFIRQAVESVLLQRTDFPVEILISEDCSTDTTRDIVRDLQRQYPENIRLFLSERNLFNNAVTARAWADARGTYIATLDGDDFWTDPLKLQKQVALMERCPDVFVCGHSVAVVDEHGHPLANRLDGAVDHDRWVSREDLAAGYGFPSMSALFRNNGRLPPTELFESVFNGDSFMWAFFANFGAGYMSREVMAAYRLHPGAVWSSLDERRAADCRDQLLSAVPLALSGSLRSIAYAKLLAHSLRHDYRWSRRLRQIPYAAAMTTMSLTPRAAVYLLKKAVRWSFGRT